VRRLLYAAALLLALGLAGLGVARWRQAELAVAAPAARDAGVIAPTVAPAEPVSLTGVLYPLQEVDLVATVEARIESVPVQLGAHVAAGDVVATLDAASLRRELKAADASVRAAQAELGAARVERASASDKARRIQRLGDVVAEEEAANAVYSERLAQAREAAAKARVGEAVARVDQLRVLLERTAIVAPFAGLIAARHVDAGALVGPNRPIARLISEELWVRFAVPEAEVGTVARGGCIRVAVTSPEVQMNGVIENVAPEIDTSLRMVFVEARVELPAELRRKLPAGLPVHVSVVACP
jgi:RND family efflux transporter MFP subunit